MKPAERINEVLGDLKTFLNVSPLDAVGRQEVSAAAMTLCWVLDHPVAGPTFEIIASAAKMVVEASKQCAESM